jgi:hypothetical protein
MWFLRYGGLNLSFCEASELKFPHGPHRARDGKTTDFPVVVDNEGLLSLDLVTFISISELEGR